MANDKIPNHSNPGLRSPTNSVRPDVGKTAGEGKAAGDAGNAAFNRGLNEQSGSKRPGNSPYMPK